MESILETVKAYLGIYENETAFDQQLIVHINTAMLTLNQLGIGPSTPYKVSDSNDSWEDVLSEVPPNGIQDYVCMQVRMLFDPPTNSYVMDALNSQIEELRWRILFDADNRNREEVTGE